MVYKDIVNNGWIQPRKEKYTMRDFKKLLKAGFPPLTARFILVCSAAHYYTTCSNVIYSRAFLRKCQFGWATF